MVLSPGLPWAGGDSAVERRKLAAPPRLSLAEKRRDAYAAGLASPVHRKRLMASGSRERSGAVLLRKARVISGDYGRWQVGAEHDGKEIWVVAEAPRRRRYRTARGEILEGLVYRRWDGQVARAEYLDLMPEFCVVDPDVSSLLH
jgi:hypothetical protein